MSRSLKFAGQLSGQPYDAVITVTGAVTGMKFGDLLLTRNDLVELGRLSAHLIMKLNESES